MTPPQLPATRRLLPRPPVLDPPHNATGVTKRRARILDRRPTKTACRQCRQRKTACDGNRPVCSSCSRKSLDCEYPPEFDKAELRAGREARDLIDQLRSLPNEEALQLFQKTRGEADSRRLSTPAIPPIISETAYLRSCLPSTSNSLEFELAIRHPIAYPVLYPVQITSLPLDKMLKPHRITCLQSPSTSPDNNYEQTTAVESTISQPDTPITESRRGSVVESTQDRPLAYESLEKVDISYWADVPISNTMAARAISFYLETDYTVLPLFHADLFIQNLVEQKSYFCSRFLVSSLLAWASQAYAAIEPDIRLLGVQAFAEAEREFSLSSPINTLTAVSALHLLGMTAVTQGRDDIAFNYLEAGVRVGKAMGLFGVQPGPSSAHAWLNGYQDWTIAASYTAWGVYNWVNVYGLHYQRAVIEAPPTLPMPGDVELIFATPIISIDQPDSKTEMFRSCCQLFVILHDVLWFYYGPKHSESPMVYASLEFAEATYYRLLVWASMLPLNLVRNDNSSHHIIMMHIYYHAIVTDIFRPFLLQTRQSMCSFSSPQATPEAAYRASVNQLKRLLLIYRLNFNTAMFSVLWQTGLIYVANAVMREVKTSSNEWHYYLHLCIAGLEDLYASFRVFGSITEAILEMALRHRALKPKESRRIKSELKELGRHHDAVERIGEGPEIATWIIDLDLSMTDPEAAQGTNLANRFQKLVIDGPEDTPKQSSGDNSAL